MKNPLKNTEPVKRRKVIASKDRKFNLAKLITAGKLSPKAKSEAKKLLASLRKGNQKRILDISWKLHQNISGSMNAKGYPLRENQDYNIKITGTSLYHEADQIAHGSY